MNTTPESVFFYITRITCYVQFAEAVTFLPASSAF